MGIGAIKGTLSGNSSNYKYIQEFFLKWNMILVILVLLVFIPNTVISTEIGLVYGPLANEESLLRQALHEPLEFYDFPVFIGGPYFVNQLSTELAYYTDILVSIHPVNYEE